MYFRPDRLRLMREKRGLSQRELSRLISIGENQINKYENGGGEPSLRILVLIAGQLGVTADYLLGLSDEPGGYAVMALDEDRRKLIEAYDMGNNTMLLRLIADRMQKLEANTSAEGKTAAQ